LYSDKDKKVERQFFVKHVQAYKRFLSVITALCAYWKPRNIFESGAKRHFQKCFCTTQRLNRL